MVILFLFAPVTRLLIDWSFSDPCRSAVFAGGRIIWKSNGSDWYLSWTQAGLWELITSEPVACERWLKKEQVNTITIKHWMRVQKLGLLSQEMFMLTLLFKVCRFPEGGLRPVSDTDRGVILSPVEGQNPQRLQFFQVEPPSRGDITAGPAPELYHGPQAHHSLVLESSQNLSEISAPVCGATHSLTRPTSSPVGLLVCFSSAADPPSFHQHRHHNRCIRRRWLHAPSARTNLRPPLLLMLGLSVYWQTLVAAGWPPASISSPPLGLHDWMQPRIPFAMYGASHRRI